MIRFRRSSYLGDSSLWRAEGNEPDPDSELADKLREALRPHVRNDGLVWQRDLLRVVAILRLNGIEVEVEE